MYFAVSLSTFGDTTRGATTQPRANSGLIGWLVVLPYLMGARTQLYIRARRFMKRGERQRVPRPLSNAEAIASILEAGQSSRPIPLFAGRKDTLNLVSGTLTASVPNVQVCQAMLLRRNFLLCPQPCLKYSQNTTL